jgi:hypothetical protein
MQMLELILRQQRHDNTELASRLQRRVLELERHTGLTENPKAPRPTRRRPLEA